MWVTEGSNGDIEPGNYLISSAVPGCAMKDDPAQFPVGYICARAAEGVKWSEVSSDSRGVKRKKISVLFESFERHSGSPALAATVKAQQSRIDALESEIKSIGQVKEQLAALQVLLEQNEPGATQAAFRKVGSQ